MRVIQCTTRVDMAAADFWALRMDQNFDAFCARFDNTDMEVLSRREEQSNGQTLQVIECLLLYRENPVPATFQHMFGERLAGTHTLCPFTAVFLWLTRMVRCAASGSEPFGFKYSARWHRDRFDQEHACTFVSEPSVMKDRICVKGRCWLVPAGPHACDVVYHEEVSVRVFGVGSVIEQVRPERAARSRALSTRLHARPSASRHGSAARCSPRCPGGRAIPHPHPRPPPPP